MTPVRAIIEPIERSIPPEMTTTAWATAASASGRTEIAEALDPVHAIARLDELGEEQEDDEEREQAEDPGVALRAADPSRIGRGRARPGSRRGGRRAHRSALRAVGAARRRQRRLGGDELLGHQRARPQVVRSPEERGLVRVGHADLRHDIAAEDHDRPIADELDLLQLGGVEQDGRAGFRQVAKQHVDLLLGADVDATGRVEAEHRRTPPATQRAIVTFCWLPPDSRRTSPRARVSICSVATAPPTFRSLRREVDQTPMTESRREWEGDVLAHGTLHEQGLRTVGRDIDQSRPDGIGRVAEGRPGSHRPAARRLSARSDPGEDVEQLVLALALERDDAEDLARVELER